jgi:hypothetical protein
VNVSTNEFRWESPLGGGVLLPPLGFIAETRTFVAFQASRWNGRAYREPTLFTLRSVDARPLALSKLVRVFHGFGDERIDVFGRMHAVVREGFISP